MKFVRYYYQAALLFYALAGAVGIAAPEFRVIPQNGNGVYGKGEKSIWRVEMRDPVPVPVKEAVYVLKKGGGTVLGQGSLTFDNGKATLQTTLDEPGTILVEVTGKLPDGTIIKGLGGAAIAPQQIQPSAPCPADFDAFWKSKLGELATVPPNPRLEKGDSGKPNVDFWKITMDNIRGTTIRGQMARPVQGTKFPALLLVQYAGVYSIPKGNVTGPAAEGWLALNILAHDLPIDEAQAFYDQQNAGPLKNYTAIGNDDREKSYFLRMFLACYRAAEYLSQRPDWNGKTLIVSGTSQGGLQAFVTAGLNPKVTGMMAMVPAGCDNTASQVGGKAGWPYWMSNVSGKDEKKAWETSRYFDAVNFAARVKCPALIGVGLIDTTSPATGVYAAFNQCRGPKEMVVMPESDHRGKNNTQAAYRTRAQTWQKALLKGTAVPPK